MRRFCVKDGCDVQIRTLELSPADWLLLRLDTWHLANQTA